MPHSHVQPPIRVHPRSSAAIFSAQELLHKNAQIGFVPSNPAPPIRIHLRSFAALSLLLATAAQSQTPWWDNYPRIVHLVNQSCGSRGADKAVALHADVAQCTTSSDPNVGVWAQRVGIFEESEPHALEKMHAAGLRTMSYFETFGQAKTFIVQVKKDPTGAWFNDRNDPRLTKRFLNHWSWNLFDGTGEIRWTGVHSYFGDEDFARPYTLTHPRYGAPPVRYPDGTLATGYNGPVTDPRNSRIYDACSVKDVNGNLYLDYGYNRTIERRNGPFTGLLQVGSRHSGTFDAGKDAACPSWIDYARASTLQAVDFGLDSMYTDNFSPWDSFGFDPVKKAFGEWSVATFRDYLAASFTPAELTAMGVPDIKTFDVRAYLRTKATEWGGDPANLEDPAWKSPRWIDDPVWRAYKIHRRQNGTRALSNYYHAVKDAAASAGKPDFPVTGNDFQGFNLGWARGDLDLVNSELQYTRSAVLGEGKYGYMLPPLGSYVSVYKRAREQARSRIAIFWMYVNPELAGHAAIADVLQYQALANHALPEAFTGGPSQNQTAGNDSTTAAFFAFLGSARSTFGARTGVEEIGLYYSSSSELVHLTLNGWPPGSHGPPHSLSFLGWGTALSWLHQQWRAIPEWKLTPDTLAGLKLLIIPDAEVFDPADVPMLKDWLARGGRLIVTGNSGIRAGEKGNFAPLRTPSLGGVGVHLPADPGPDFTNSRDDRPSRLAAFAAALDDIGFKGLVSAPAVPYTVGVTLYDDPKAHRRFIDLNNTDIDVAADTIHPSPPIHLEIPLPAWLDPKTVSTQLLTPDTNVSLSTHPQGNTLTIDLTGLQRYASLVVTSRPVAERLHLHLAPDHERRPLVDILRLNIQNALLAIGRTTAGLFRDERDGIGLIQQPHLAARMMHRGRIQEHAPGQQSPMEICHQRPDVPRTVLPSPDPAAQPGKVVAIQPRETIGVGFIHRVVLSLIRHANIVVAENIRADRRIQRESEDSLPRRVNQNRGRPVNDIPGGNLLHARLQHRRHGILLHLQSPEDRKDRPHADVDVDVRRPVQRIEHDQVLAGIGRPVECHRLFVLLRNQHGHRVAQPETMQQRLVGVNVEFLLGLALNVGLAHRPQDVQQSGLPHFGLNHLGSECDAREQHGEGPAGPREVSLLLPDDVLLHRDNHCANVPQASAGFLPPPLLKKLSQQLTALEPHNPLHHLHPMVQQIRIRQAKLAANPAETDVPSPEHHCRNPRRHQRPRAHDAWLDGGIKRRPFHAIIADRTCRLSQRHDLRMRARIVPPNRTIGPSSDHPSPEHHYCPDRNLAVRLGFLGQRQGIPHEIFMHWTLLA